MGQLAVTQDRKLPRRFLRMHGFVLTVFVAATVVLFNTAGTAEAADSGNDPSSGIHVGPSIPAEPAPSQVPIGPLPPHDDDPGRVAKMLNNWFGDLATAMLTPMVPLISQTFLATPQVIHQARITGLWNVMLGIADTLAILFVVAGGVVVAGYDTVQTRYSVKDIAPRIVVGFLAANASLYIVGQTVHITNALSTALVAQGIDATNLSTWFTRILLSPLEDGGIFVVLLALSSALMIVILFLTYLMRIALLTILAVGGPVALMCHAVPGVDGLARLWWRAVVGCMLIQLAQALVLSTVLWVFFGDHSQVLFGINGMSNSLVNLLLTLVLLFVLLRIPFWVFGNVLATSRSTVVTIIKHHSVHRGQIVLKKVQHRYRPKNSKESKK